MKRYIVHKRRRGWDYLRDVLWVLVARDFKIRYKHSLLGIGWSLMVPITQYVVLFLVFNILVPLNIPHFTTFLFTGFLPWTWFQTSLLASTTVVVENSEMVRTAGFPVALLPVISVIAQSIHFLLALPVLAVFLVNDGYHTSLPLLALPIVVAIELVLTLGLAYILASLQVKFRDVQYLVGIVLFLAFYLTPVFWSEDRISEPWRSAMGWNPMAVIINAYRAILMKGEWPALIPMLSVAAGSFAMLVIGYKAFSVAQDRFVEEF